MVVEGLRGAAFDYPHSGASLRELPKGWYHDDATVVLGSGAAVWDRAVQALTRWQQFDLSWVQAHDDAVPLQPGRMFAFVSRQLGVWSVNVCRVVEVVESASEHHRCFGFAYGTVGRHVVRGEEAFLLEQDLTSGEVRFRIRKFSRPGHPLVFMIGRWALSLQRSFTRDALARVAREVSA
jgi:uncharacterized protein (UPF0548 family)